MNSFYSIYVKKILNFVWGKKWLILIILVVGYLVYQFIIPQNPKEEALQEYTVTKGSVLVSISSTGKVQASKLQNLVFGIQGKVTEIVVNEGQFVNQGAYIGSLDTTALNAQVKIAQGGLQTANANYANTKQSLEPQIQEVSNKNIELDKKLAEETHKTTLSTNKNSEEKAKLGIEIAEESLDSSEDALDNLEEEKKLSKEVSDANVDVGELSSEEAEDLAEAQKDLSQAQYEAQIEASENQLDIEEKQNEQIEIDFDTLKENNNLSELQSAVGIEKVDNQAQIGALQKEQSEISKKNTLNSIAGQITTAQGNLDTAKYNLSQAKLYAPFSGVILDIPIKVGDFFAGPQSPQSILLGDLDNLIVEAEINELDILSIKVGQKAIVELEADPGVEYVGVVEKINPAPLVDASGVVNYIVEVSLAQELGEVFQGLSANVEIITEEKTEVVQIPFVAINRREDGEYVSIKQSDGTIVEKKVETGLQSITNVEILSGLAEGDIIVY